MRSEPSSLKEMFTEYFELVFVCVSTPTIFIRNNIEIYLAESVSLYWNRIGFANSLQPNAVILLLKANDRPDLRQGRVRWQDCTKLIFPY